MNTDRLKEPTGRAERATKIAADIEAIKASQSREYLGRERQVMSDELYRCCLESGMAITIAELEKDLEALLGAETEEVRMSLIEIPTMTHPLSIHWRQPNTSNFAVDNEIAMMSKRDFDALPEYSISTPTGVYEGKCWKAKRGGIWYLRWYDKDDGDPRGLPTPWRKIVVIDV